MKNKILFGTGLFLVVLLVYFGINYTYSANEQYMITFNRSQKNEILEICKTGTDGKIDKNTCYGAVSTHYDGICGLWGSGGRNYSNNEIKNLTITEDMDFYCVRGNSYTNWTYLAKCFKCGDQFYWQIAGGGDSTPNHPEYGFPRVGVDSKTCVIASEITEKDKCKAPVANACYICDGTYKWTNDPQANCKKQNNITSESDCKAPANACYICDGTYKWTNDPQANCKKQNNITSESDCKAPVIVKETKCYVCNGEYRWTNDPEDKCILQEKITDQANCKITNPQTGSYLIYIVWIIGISSITYAIIYFAKMRKISR